MGTAVTEARRAKLDRHQYDRLFRIACSIVDHENLCGVRNGTCSRGRHLKREGEKRNPYASGKDRLSFCCGSGSFDPRVKGCEHLGPKGCVGKSLACKLWLCGHVHEGLSRTIRGRRIQRKLRQLQACAYENNFYVVRGSRKQALADAKRRRKSRQEQETES